MEEKEPVNKEELGNVGHLVTAMKGSVEPIDLDKVCNHLNYLDFGSHVVYLKLINYLTVIIIIYTLYNKLRSTPLLF